MNDTDTIDDLIVAIVDQSDQLLGFVREDAAPHWRLLVADDSWIDLAISDDGLLSIGTEVGAIGPAEGSHRLHQLMLQYLGFHADTAFCVDAAGAYRLQQVLPPHALEAAQLKNRLEHLASRAHAWRDLMQMPQGDARAIEILQVLPDGLRA